MSSRSVVAWVGLVAVGVALPRVADACKCRMPELREATDGADAVFVGRAERTTTSPDKETFTVERVWKGQVPATAQVENSAGSCKFIFDAGARYLVFAQEVEGALELHACGGTRSTDLAADWLAALGPGNPPTGSAITPTSEVPKTSPRAGCSIHPTDVSRLAPLLLALTWTRRRRTRRRARRDHH